MPETSIGIKIDPTGAMTGGRVVRGEFDAIKRDARGAEAAAVGFGTASNDNFRKAASSARLAASAMNMLRLAIVGVAAVAATLAVGPYLRLADQAKQLNAQILLVAGSQEKATATGQRLRDVSEETRSSFGSTVTLYTKLARATDDLGISEERLLGVTRTIAQAYKVSGASAEEAANSMRQLAQGLQAGQLRGDEFISVMEGAPRLARAIAEGMGYTNKSMRELSQQGKLTAEAIVKALETQGAAIAAEFAKIPATADEAFRAVGDSLLFLVGKFDSITGLSDTMISGVNAIADAVDWVSANLETLLKIAGVVGAALLAAFSPALLAMIASATFAIGVGMVGAVRALTIAMAMNPIGALVVAITAAITAAYLFRDEIKKAIGIDLIGIVKTAANLFIGAWVASFRAIKIVWDDLPAIMGDAAVQAGNALISGIEAAINKIIPMVKSFYRMLNPLAALADASGSDFLSQALGTGVLPESVTMGRVGNPWQGATGRAGSGISEAVSGAMSTDYLGNMAGSFGEMSQAILPDPVAAQTLKNIDKVDKGAAKLAKAYASIVREANQSIQSFQQQSEALFMSEEAAAQARHQQELLNKAQDAGIKLTAAQRAELMGLGAVIGTAEVGYERLKETFDFAKDTVKGFVSDLRNGLQNGETFWESFKSAALNALDKIIDKLLNEVLDALFQVNNAAGSGGGGGILGSILGLLGGGGGGFSPFEMAWTAAVPGLWANGGYTGPGSKYQPAGIVHAGEYVFSAAATNRIGVSNLDAMHRSAKGYADGGYVGSAPANQNSSRGDVVTFAPVIHQDLRGAQRGVGPEAEAAAKRALGDITPQVVKALREIKRKGIAV